MHKTLKANHIKDELSTELIEKIENCYLIAETFFKRSFSRPLIKLDLKGQSAGTATPTKNLIRFNEQLLTENKQHFLKQTVPHEIAHLIAYQLFGLAIKPHGKEWQHIMQTVYQLPALRCHPYKVANKTRCYYLYTCQCLNLKHSLTTRRHHLINKGYQYICKHCKKILSFSGETHHQ